MDLFVLFGVLHGKGSHCRFAMGIVLTAGITGPALATTWQSLIHRGMLETHSADHLLLRRSVLMSPSPAPNPHPSQSPEAAQSEAHIRGSLEAQEKLRHKRRIDHGINHYVQGQLQRI